MYVVLERERESKKEREREREGIFKKSDRERERETIRSNEVKTASPKRQDREGRGTIRKRSAGVWKRCTHKDIYGTTRAWT